MSEVSKAYHYPIAVAVCDVQGFSFGFVHCLVQQQKTMSHTLLKSDAALTEPIWQQIFQTTVCMNMDVHQNSQACMQLGNVHLARWFVVSLYDQLHAIGAHLEPIKELEHVQLTCIIRQTLDLDHTVTLTGKGL